MSTVAGVFSETQLYNLQLKADAVWNDRIQKEDYTANVSILQGLISKIQTAKIKAKFKSKKDVVAEIAWINACEIDNQACSNCDVEGTELSTNKEEYKLDICRESAFKVSESDYVDNLFEMQEVLAVGFVEAGNELDEYLAQQAVAWLNIAAGRNELGNVGPKIVSGITGDTSIPPAYWNSSLMGYLARGAIMNRFKNPHLFSGSNLFEQLWNAEKDQYNADGKGNWLKFGTMDINFDLFNIDQVNTPDLITYMVNRGAFAIANKAYYEGNTSANPMVRFDAKQWSIPSRNLPGIMYDVLYKSDCEEADNFSSSYNHRFKLQVHAGMFLNPVGCTEERTGVLRFICEEASS